MLNTDTLNRLTQIKKYINNINGSLEENDQTKAMLTVSRFKKTILKEDFLQLPNQMVLETQRGKIEKLRAEVEEMRGEKKRLEGAVEEGKVERRELKRIVVGAFVSRLSLTLEHCDKVDYEEIHMRSDYEHLVIDSAAGSKYKDYTIAVDNIDRIEHNQFFLLLSCRTEAGQAVSILANFQTQKDTQRWAVCLKFAKMIQSSKKREKLFEKEKKPQLKPQKSKKSFGQRSHVGLLGAGLRNRSLMESQISERRETEKDTEKNEKNTEKELVNAIGVHDSGLVQPTFLQKRQNTNNSNRIRGMSDQNAKALEVFKGKHNPRKQSEDIFKPHATQTYHEKMLENLRYQEGLDEDRKSEVSRPKNSDKTDSGEGEASKLKMLEEKKKQLLSSHTKPLTVDRPNFLMGGSKPLNWIGIEEKEDESKSKSSYMSKGSSRDFKSRRTSEFNSNVNQSSQQNKPSDKSEHITEKSEEESPLPKQPSFEPQKVSYQNGVVIKLHQVASDPPNSSSPNLSSPSFEPEHPTSFPTSFPPPRQEKEAQPESEEEEQDTSQDQEQPDETEEDENARFEELKEGISVIKCAENGFWKHDKILFISENEKELCSRDVEDKKVKKIPIKNIQSVEYKKFDKGILKHMKGTEEEKCLVIRALAEDNKIKNFEFVGHEIETLRRFSHLLEDFVNKVKEP